MDFLPFAWNSKPAGPAPEARHLCRTRTKEIFQLRQERYYRLEFKL
jgi:hypothetical protein